MSMATAYLRYVIWTPRPRNHGSTGLQLLSIAGDPKMIFPINQAPSVEFGDGEARVAFWSVTGAADGAQVSTDNVIQPNVGTTDLRTTVWLIPKDDPHTPDVIIDAFDVALGDFVDDDFVDVVNAPNLTAQANNDGLVPTASAEDVRARTRIHEAPFENWLVFPKNGEKVTVRDIHAAVNTSAFAFAFYRPTVIPRYAPFIDEILAVWYSAGVPVDGGGHGGPFGGPRGPIDPGPGDPRDAPVRQLAAGLALVNLASLVESDLRVPLSRIATRQIESASQNIVRSIENGISDTIGTSGLSDAQAIAESIS
jgi:hypothetical protein